MVALFVFDAEYAEQNKLLDDGTTVGLNDGPDGATVGPNVGAATVPE